MPNNERPQKIVVAISQYEHEVLALMAEKYGLRKGAIAVASIVRGLPLISEDAVKLADYKKRRMEALNVRHKFTAPLDEDDFKVLREDD